MTKPLAIETSSLLSGSVGLTDNSFSFIIALGMGPLDPKRDLDWD